MEKLEIVPATDGKHKWVAIFTKPDGTVRRTSFGAKGYEDLTIHRNRFRATLYRLRHQRRENWNDPYSAGSLAWNLLWASPNFNTNTRRFKNRFGFE